MIQFQTTSSGNRYGVIRRGEITFYVEAYKTNKAYGYSIHIYESQLARQSGSKSLEAAEKAALRKLSQLLEPVEQLAKELRGKA